MTPNLTTAENGLIVFDTDDDKFYYWLDNEWVAGLGILNSSIAGGDLQGEFPNLFVRSQAITNNKLVESAVSTQKILNSAVTSDKINENAITKDKVANGAITGEKLETLTTITPGITFGNSFNLLQISLDNKGRVVSLSETGIWSLLKILKIFHCLMKTLQMKPLRSLKLILMAMLIAY